MAVSACARRFIFNILCGNPIVRGALTTTLSSIVLEIDAEIAILTASLGRLNFIQQLTNLEIQTVQAILNKITADLNLIFGPLRNAADCPEINKILETIERNGATKKVVGLQNNIYRLNRVANLATRQDAIIKQKNKIRDDILDFIDEIGILCT